ncbi:MAG TPA: sugar phosphate nucleotidyltransferase, partial [Phycisphaerae bacterium]|nr:sugar phosphate nucleotidyltransferase [Phycisphaerae bacterium]
NQIEFIVQAQPLGFGHAVWLARGFVGGGPFMLMLGDHVHLPDDGQGSCTEQVAEAFASVGGAAMVGMQPVGPDELPRVGVAAGAPVQGDIYRCTDFVEKPDLATARSRLATPGLETDRFLAHNGIYVFTQEIFDCLEGLIPDECKPGREVQLADAQLSLLKGHPQDYYLVRVRGRAYDVGTPAGYAATLAALSGRG